MNIESYPFLMQPLYHEQRLSDVLSKTLEVVEQTLVFYFLNELTVLEVAIVRGLNVVADNLEVMVAVHHMIILNTVLEPLLDQLF